MAYKVDNAIIMAAGMSSRFAPISYEKPKALVKVKGEIMIERQIEQLISAGIDEIILVVGFMKESFYYLKEKYGVIIVENNDYDVRNNNSSIFAARDYLKNSYVCSADNYFRVSPFENEVEESYYAALYASEETGEWCIKTNSDDYITDVEIGGRASWYMLGHTFWRAEFSDTFLEILLKIYDKPETSDKLWESIYKENIDKLHMKIRRYPEEDIFEFDALDELRMFDESYKIESGSLILAEISKKLKCAEGELNTFLPLKNEKGEVTGFSYHSPLGAHSYYYEDKKVNL